MTIVSLLLLLAAPLDPPPDTAPRFAVLLVRSVGIHNIAGATATALLAAVVRLSLRFALEPLDWAIREEFSDLCLCGATHTFAQKAEGPVSPISSE